MRTKEEIKNMANEVDFKDALANLNKNPANREVTNTYEEGVSAALEWVLGFTSDEFLLGESSKYPDYCI